MSANRKSGSHGIDAKGHGAPKKLPYQKPELVEIDLSGESQGGKPASNGFEITLTSIGLTAGPS